MCLLRDWLGLSVIALASTVSALDDQQSTGQPTASDSPLSADELKNATSVDALTVPTPGEFFKAIEKGGKPKWTSEFRPPIPIKSTDRAQMTLHLGSLIADGNIPVEAQDSQQVKNIGKDVMALAKKLSVYKTLMA